MKQSCLRGSHFTCPRCGKFSSLSRVVPLKMQPDVTQKGMLRQDLVSESPLGKAGGRGRGCRT